MRKTKHNIYLEQYREMERIAKRYQLSLMEKKLTLPIDAESRFKLRIAKDHVKLFNRILNSLDDNSRLIIRYVFLKPSQKEWIKNQYSHSTFYRLRNKAINAFIERFYR